MSGYFSKNVAIGAAEILCRLPYIFTVGYMAKQIGPAMFGVWALVIVFQGIFSALAGLGLPSALSVHAPVVDPGRAHAYLMFAARAGLLASLLGALLTFAGGAQMAAVLGLAPEYAWLLLAGAALATGTVLDSLFDAYCKARERVRLQLTYLGIRTSIEVILVLVTFAPQFWQEAGAAERLFAYAMAVALLKLVAYGILAFTDRDATSVPIAGEARARLLGYGLHMVAPILVMRFASQADRYALGLAAPQDVVGVYAFGASLAAYVVFLGYAVYPLLLTRVSKLHAEQAWDEITRLYRASQAIYLRLAAPALAFLALFSGEIIDYTAGAAFSGAADVLFALAVAISLDHFFGIYEFSLMAGHRQRLILLTQVFNVAAIVLAVYLFGRYGALPAAWGMLLVAILHNGLRYVLAQRTIRAPVAASNVAWFATVAAGAVALHQLTLPLELVVRLLLALVLLPGLLFFSLRGLRKCAV